MSESQLGRFDGARVAAAVTAAAELVVVAVVPRLFAGDVVMLGAGALWVLLSAPVVYAALAKAFRERG